MEFFPPSAAFTVPHLVSIYKRKTLLEKVEFKKNLLEEKKLESDQSPDLSFTNKECTGIKMHKMWISTGCLMIAIRTTVCILFNFSW